MDRNEKHRLGNDKNIPIEDRASVLYSDSPITRALVSTIPFVGNLIDNVLTTKSQAFVQRRIDTYLEGISSRLKKLEAMSLSIDDETIYDLFRLVLEKVSTTKSNEKIRRFSSITVNCLNGRASWDETEAAVELINSISEPQMKILLMANSTKGYISVSKLPSIFESFTEVSSQLFCADLVAKGLLFDKGVSYLDGGAMELLASSSLNSWLLEKINSLDSDEI